MKNAKKLIFLLGIGIILSGCSNDPVVTQPEVNEGYQQVYYQPGVQDSMAIGTFLFDYLDLGVLNFTNSDSVKISFDYVANNTLTHQFIAYYYQSYPTGGTFLANLNITGSQNTYKHVEFIAPSPNASVTFYYKIERTNREDSYMVLRNFKVSKK